MSFGIWTSPALSPLTGATRRWLLTGYRSSPAQLTGEFGLTVFPLDTDCRASTGSFPARCGDGLLLLLAAFIDLRIDNGAFRPKFRRVFEAKRSFVYTSFNSMLVFHANSTADRYPVKHQVHSLVRRLAHSFTYVSQPCGSFSPRVMAKNSSCRLLVIGPREPLPTAILSTILIGVISAAVPVKKISSAA
jgi:hypothetical protein